MANSNVIVEKPKKKKKTLGKIFGGIFAAIVIFLLGFQIIGQISARSNHGIPKYGSYQTFRVLTDSMVPTYKVDTMLFVKEVDVKTLKGPSADGVNDGDVITFKRNYGPSYTMPGDGLIVTHRIVKIEVQEDGSIYFRTLGDNLKAKTCGASGCTMANADYVRDTDILGKVVGQNYVFGKISSVLANPIVMVALIIVPLLFIFGSSLVDLIRELKKEEQTSGDAHLPNDEFEKIKEQEKLKLMIELEKERLRKEISKGGTEDGNKE